MIRFLALTIFCTLFAIAPSHAQEQTAEPEKVILDTDLNYIHSPEYCDFMAGFPEEPMTTYHCENPNDKASCFDLASYTKVFGLSSTVKVEVICNPATKEMYKHFTPEVMETTVKAMTKDNVVKVFDISSREEDEYRQSGIVASGKQGLDETLYIAQLWIAGNSIMSVEAEIMGEQIPEADKLFADILRNIGYTKDIKGKEFGEKKIQAYLEKKKAEDAKNDASDLNE